MKNCFFIIILFLAVSVVAEEKKDGIMEKKFRELTKEEKRVIIDKGTEMPFTGKYNDFFEDGYYHCKQCDERLYKSKDKFQTGCGWPGFDDELPGAVLRKEDADGVRTEILCKNCGAHLGHVFIGERMTPKNTRHCVNSVSLVFKPEKETDNLKKAYFAGGCFWGVEYQMERKKGVIDAVSGYMGGLFKNPTYRDVVYGKTAHLETVEVLYDSSLISYEELTKFFFEIHDPTQENGQGPDIGDQYKSVIFYQNEEEKAVIEKLINILKSKGYDVVTELKPVTEFWKAEDYHQDYYQKNKKYPYCHRYEKKF